jgi:hypothetical protein
MLIDMTAASHDSHLVRMFSLRDWDVQQAASEWLRENRKHREEVANLVHEMLNATRFLLEAFPNKKAYIYERRNAAHAQILKDHGYPPRQTYDALIDAAVSSAAAHTYAEQRQFFDRHPNLPCGTQDAHAERFEVGRRLAQLYMAAAMRL